VCFAAEQHRELVGHHLCGTTASQAYHVLLRIAEASARPAFLFSIVDLHVAPIYRVNYPAERPPHLALNIWLEQFQDVMCLSHGEAIHE